MGKITEKTENSVLVCVTDQFSCEKLIHAGKDFAKSQGKRLAVFSVQPKGNAAASSEALEHLFNIAKQVEAEMTVFYSDDAVKIAADYIKTENISDVIVGCPSSIEKGFVQTISEISNVQVWIFNKSIIHKYKISRRKLA